MLAVHSWHSVVQGLEPTPTRALREAGRFTCSLSQRSKHGQLRRSDRAPPLQPGTVPSNSRTLPRRPWPLLAFLRLTHCDARSRSVGSQRSPMGLLGSVLADNDLFPPGEGQFARGTARRNAILAFMPPIASDPRPKNKQLAS